MALAISEPDRRRPEAAEFVRRRKAAMKPAIHAAANLRRGNNEPLIDDVTGAMRCNATLGQHVAIAAGTAVRGIPTMAEGGRRERKENDRRETPLH